MMTPTPRADLRPAPGFAVALRQQLWLLVASRRWAWLLGAMVALQLVTHITMPPAISRLAVAAAVTLLAAAFWPVSVWHGEGPARRTYHWSLPVSRPLHELARVAAGALLLFLITVVTAAVAAAMQGTAAPLFAPGPQAWGNFLLAPLVLYLLLTPAVLWSDYRSTHALLGALFVVCATGALASEIGIEAPARLLELVFMNDPWGLQWALFTAPTVIIDAAPDPTVGWGGVALWLSLGTLGTLFTAAFRPDDLARLRRRPAEAAATP